MKEVDRMRFGSQLSPHPAPISATTVAPSSLRRSERRQCEDAALPVARASERHVDRRTIRRGGDAVDARITERAAVERDMADRYDVADLTHADDRVVGAIGDVDIRAVIEGRVACA